MKRLRFSIFFLAVVIVIFTVASQEAQGQNMIQVKGSDSEVNLVQRLAELFMQKKPWREHCGHRRRVRNRNRRLD